MDEMTTITAIGKYGSPVTVQVAIRPTGNIVASAEDEHLTESQLCRAVREAYPDHEVVGAGRMCGFWYATGRAQ